MNIEMWKINMDPFYDFEYVDSHRSWEKVIIVESTDTYMKISNSQGFIRKVLLDNSAYRFFEKESAAMKYYFDNLIKLKFYLRKETLAVNKQLRRRGPESRGRPSLLVTLIYPDGTSSLVSKKQAMKITGLSSGGFSACLSRGNITRKGYRLKRPA